MKRLFMYGTLRHKQPNFNAFIPDLVPVAKDITTKPEWTMVVMGGFPGVLVGGTTAVVGDVFEVPEERVPPLDRLEGHPHFYKRTPIELADGTKAEMYVLQGDNTDRGRPAIVDGDWLHYLAEYRKGFQR